VSITVVYQGAAEITGAPVVSSRLPNLIALPAAASSAKEDGPLRLAQIELSTLHPNKNLPGAFLFITTLPPTSTHTHLTNTSPDIPSTIFLFLTLQLTVTSPANFQISLEMKLRGNTRPPPIQSSSS
jgi:hypothetical protein